MNIVILDGYTVNPGDLSWDALGALGKLTVYDRTSFSDEAEIIRRIGGHEIVITNKTPITKRVLDACPHVRMIGVMATGYNVVDTLYAAEKGIPVSNVPAYGTDSVAQFTFALLLEICHHVGDHARKVSEGEWARSRDFCFWAHPLIELSGKTMGIVGFGRIGQAVGRIAAAFGMRVLAFNRSQSDAGRKIAEYVSLDELLQNSDVISLNCPLTDETKGLINRDAIGKMKSGVILLNTARGPLVVERDLADALNTGKVYAAGMDVVSSEPISADNPLLTAKNAFITPHIAWAPRESRARIIGITAKNIAAFQNGCPANVVNP